MMINDSDSMVAADPGSQRMLYNPIGLAYPKPMTNSDPRKKAKVKSKATKKKPSRRPETRIDEKIFATDNK